MNEITHLSAKKDGLKVYLEKIWMHRHLIWVLAQRDLKAKYAQTLLGILWSVVQPLTSLIIFVFFFELVINVSDRINYSYAVFAFSGMLCWNYFSFVVNRGGTALLESQDLIKKIYFPKIIPLLSRMLAGFADLGTSMILLVILLIFRGIIPSSNIIFLPFFLILLVIVSCSISIWINALTIRYRDFHHIIPYLIGYSIWLTPVFYPSTLLPDEFNFILYLNPVAGVIEGFRWALIPNQEFSSYYFVGISISIVLLIFGLFFFRRVEDQIADLI